MCGIVGFTGREQAAPILLDGLSKLEYRGYDSAGIAVRDGENPVDIVKAKGRLKILAEKTNDGKAVVGSCGIGHTRWATHGEPSENNAHPHRSDNGNIVAVHNGIIENYQELKEKLVRKGYTFYSDTDTEVAVKLIDYYYTKYEGTPVDAINHAMVRIRGSYALAVMFNEYPEEIYVARKDSPMILGVEDGESYIASDVPAILKYTRNVYYIGNMEMARVRKGEITFYNLDGDEIEKELKTIDWNAEAAEKAGYEHFMMKEIHEQPKVVGDTINSVVKEDFIDLSNVGLSEEDIKEISQIYIVACGSAYHVGIAAQKMLTAARYAKKGFPFPNLKVVDEGALKGFVSVNRSWTGFTGEDYEKASQSAYYDQTDIDDTEKEERKDSGFDLSGYEIVRAQFFSTRLNPAMTISEEKVTFNTACLKKFENVEYVEILFNSVEKCIAVRPCDKDDINAVKWGTIRNGKWAVLPKSCKGFSEPLFDLMNWNDECKYRFRGQYSKENNEQILLFDLEEPEVIKHEIIQEDLPDINISECVKDTENKTKKIVRTLFPKQWKNHFGCRTEEVVLLHRVKYCGNWDVLRPAKTVEGMEVISENLLKKLDNEAQNMIEKMRCAV